MHAYKGRTKLGQNRPPFQCTG